MQTVASYIAENHCGRKAAFAREAGVLPQQVTKWINSGFLVTDEGFIIPPTTKQLSKKKPDDAG